MSTITNLYGRVPSLLTDLYQLTMAYAHWYNGTSQREAVFHLFFRQAPFNNGFAIACGLETALDYITELSFDRDDIAYLATLEDRAGERLFSDGFLDYLHAFRFTGAVDAVAEGTALFPNQPMLRIRAPILEAQLLETALLNLTNFPTLVATKAGRMAHVAGSDQIVDFGLRKAQGIDGGVSAARAAYIGGCAGTSNVLAGRLFGIPVYGTHAHSLVMAFESELEAFEAYANALPDNCVFLVDTYDTQGGVRNAIEAGKKLRANGHEMAGIRLDSGNLYELSIMARQMLDEAGFSETRIAASSSLDEDAIAEMKAAGAPIVFWGVGTRLITAQPDAALDGVYKLAAIKNPQGRWSYRMKLSDDAGKLTRPGLHQVRRFKEANDRPTADLLFDEAAPNTAWAADQNGADWSFEPNSFHDDLLEPAIRAGRRIRTSPDLSASQAYARRQFQAFAERPAYPALVDRYLEQSSQDLADWLHAQSDSVSTTADDNQGETS